MSYYTSLDNMNNVDELSDAVELIRELRDEVRNLEKRLMILEEAMEEDNSALLAKVSRLNQEVDRERWNRRFNGAT